MVDRRGVDTLVIGGGPAGALSAALLAQAGREVVLVERAREPQEKLCGDFLSGEAARSLARVAIDPRTLGALPIDRLRLVFGERWYETALPFPAYGLSRRVLDEALLERAVRLGAGLVRGHAVRRLAREEGEWRATLAAASPIAAGRVLLATGKHDLHGYPRKDTHAREWLGLKMPFTLTAAARTTLGAAIELYVYQGFYAGLQALPGAQANLCIAVPKPIFIAAGATWSGLIETMQVTSPVLASRLQGARAQRDRPLAIARIPYGYLARRDGEPALIRIGDQAAVVPSFTGDGVAMALQSAEQAADAILAARDDQAAAAIAASHGRVVRRAIALSHVTLSKPGRAMLARAFAFSPKLAGRLAALTRVQ
jgi:flavin-dependent dehydrogenase